MMKKQKIAAQSSLAIKQTEEDAQLAAGLDKFEGPQDLQWLR